MGFTYTTLLLAVLAIGQAVAGPFRHAHFHNKKHTELLNVEARIEERDPAPNFNTVLARDNAWEPRSVAAPVTTAAATGALSNVLTSADLTKLTGMGCMGSGVNAVSNNGGVWIGTGGPYTNEFINESGEALILVIWGPWASWVNANKPLVTVSLAPGASTIVSFASGAVGAWSAIYPDTELVNGQISNTWGEYTFSPEGVVDISREVNMNGHSMSIVGPQCTANMETCVFVCSAGTVCETGYELLNCAIGSQPGAQYGTYGGSPSGGCGGLGSAAALTTTFL